MPIKITAKKITNFSDNDIKLGYGDVIPAKSECLISLKQYKNFAFGLDRNKDIVFRNYSKPFHGFSVIRKFEKPEIEEDIIVKMDPKTEKKKVKIKNIKKAEPKPISPEE